MEFQCRIRTSLSSESAIHGALGKALPELHWEEGDSSWDKILVWGTSADAMVKLYRYESPGPLDLTIVLKGRERGDAERAWHVLRDQVLQALEATIWKPLEPQPVALVRMDGAFPAVYEFDCDLGMREIKKILDDAEFWFWEAFQKPALGHYLDGRIPFQVAGRALPGSKERVRITGVQPNYRMEIINWKDERGRNPTFHEVHETLQSTMLPAIGARNVRRSGAG